MTSTHRSRLTLAHHRHLLTHRPRGPSDRERSPPWLTIPVAGCAHQAGTARFGTDPRTSVLNADCRAHEADNLYVVDTSFFPSISAVNPALTAMANAIRVGDHLLERLR
jgi:choline dehydrogenase-like flavoprotein